MDNLTHSLLGVAIGKTRLASRARLALPAAVIAANLPDADAVTLWAGQGTYLIHHRGITHSLVGIVALAVLLTGGAWAAERVLARRAGQDPPQLSALAWPVGLGLASHLALDALNTYGVRPFLPFDGRWYYGDLLYIAEPWLWILLGSIAALAGPRTRAGSMKLGIVAVLAVFLIQTSSRAPAAFVWPWTAAIAALAALRIAGVGRAHPRRVYAVVTVLLAAYIGAVAWGRTAAFARGAPVMEAHFPPGETAQRWVRGPRPGDPFRWTLSAMTDEAVYKLEVTDDDTGTRMHRLARNLDDPLVQAAARRPEAEAWHVFARLPFATPVPDGDGGAEVVLSDGRYTWVTAAGWASTTVTFDADELAGIALE